MLLLAADQVTYCQVISLQADHASQGSEGVFHQGKLFTAEGQFPKEQKQDAIQQAKNLTLKHKGKLLVLVIEEATGYRIWQQNDQVKIREQQKPTIATLNLEKLVAKMRNVGGIRIEDRRYKLKVYPRCFVGSEAVAWFMRTLKLAKPEAIQLGQRLVEEKWIHHVTDDHAFEDSYLFYRFYWDE